MSTPAATYRKLSVFTKTTNFEEAVKVVHVPLVEPAPDRLRIKQIYAGINATDITTAAIFTDGKLPYDIGFEAAGVIDAIGSSVPAGKFTIGQPVLLNGSNRFGTLDGFAEYSYKTVESIIPIPQLKPEYLVSLVNGLTASIGLDQAGRVQAGDKVLITAAAGGTGQIAVQWAKQRGAYVIGITSSLQKAKYLTELGADFVINYREENLDQVLKDKFPDGIDVIWETLGGEIFNTLFNHLAIKGRLVIVGKIQSYKNKGPKNLPIENVNGRLLSGSRSLNGFVLFNYSSLKQDYLPKLITAIGSGEIKAQVDLGTSSPGGKFFGVDQIYRAEEWLHSSNNIGKVVVQLQNL